jgi:hypothetical protein
MIKDSLSIMQIGAFLAQAVNMKTWPLCVYGSDRIPENAVLSSSISECLASAIYQIADGRVTDPVYVGHEPGQLFCRCIGGPAWFGYCGFDPRLPGLMSNGSMDENQTPKRLKANDAVARETYEAVGEIKSLGRYVVIRRCQDTATDPGVKCIICFGSGEQVRDLCALAHFGSSNTFGAISVPWGTSMCHADNISRGNGLECFLFSNIHRTDGPFCQEVAAGKLPGNGNPGNNRQENGRRCEEVVFGQD